LSLGHGYSSKNIRIIRAKRYSFLRPFSSSTMRLWSLGRKAGGRPKIRERALFTVLSAKPVCLETSSEVNHFP